MRIQKEFRPITIIIETKEDRDFFYNVIDKARRGDHNPFYLGPRQSDFRRELEAFERRLA